MGRVSDVHPPAGGKPIVAQWPSAKEQPRLAGVVTPASAANASATAPEAAGSTPAPKP